MDNNVIPHGDFCKRCICNGFLYLYNINEARKLCFLAKLSLHRLAPRVNLKLQFNK